MSEHLLDIILWASAVGLWVWVLIEIVVSVNKFKAKVNQTKDKAYLAQEMLVSHQKICDRRYYWSEVEWNKVLKRLDAIEAKLKKVKP